MKIDQRKVKGRILYIINNPCSLLIRSQEKTRVLPPPPPKPVNSCSCQSAEKYFPDNIALPEFASGAMENWGLITYREDRLLFDPLESKSVNKAGMTGTMAHELVHMVYCQSVFM